MSWKQITVEDQERVLVAKNGRVSTILAPGYHRIFVPNGVSLDVEKHIVSELVFQSTWADALIRYSPELTKNHFHRVETNDTQVALVYVNGGLHTVLTPSKRLLFWRGLAKVTAEFVDLVGRATQRGKQRKLWLSRR